MCQLSPATFENLLYFVGKISQDATFLKHPVESSLVQVISLHIQYHTPV